MFWFFLELPTSYVMQLITLVYVVGPRHTDKAHNQKLPLFENSLCFLLKKPNTLEIFLLHCVIQGRDGHSAFALLAALSIFLTSAEQKK